MSNPLVVDNTMLAGFRGCHRKYYYRHEEGLTTSRTPAALSFGAAFHAGMAASLQGRTKDEAIAIAIRSMREQELPTNGKEEWRCADKLIQILDVILAQQPIEVVRAPNGEPIVEADFVYPLLTTSDEDIMPLLKDCGYDDVMYSGILDAVGTFFGETYVVDHKTTTDVGGTKGEKPQIRSSFLKSFKPHSATAGYAWGLSKFLGKPVYGVLINGVGIHTSRVLSPNFQVADWLCTTRFTISYTPEEIEEWRVSTIAMIKELLHAKLDKNWAMNSDACYNYNKACPFLQVCSIPPSQRNAIKDAIYVKDTWNPLEARKKEASRLGGEL